MWEREEASKPVNPAPPADVAERGVGNARKASQIGDQDVMNIGQSVVIKGELSGSEDLTIEGHVEGQIDLKQHVLTIGRLGRIKARVVAKVVVVLGEVVGNIQASDKVAIRDSGAVEGDIVAPRVAIAEGARFRGKIDMQDGAKFKVRDEPRLGAGSTGQTQPETQAKAATDAPAPATAAP